jgi:hypothetical protein
MNITNAQYYRDSFTDTETNIGIKCLVDGEEMCVPLKVGNRHYNEIMRQVDAGTLTIAEAE